MSPVPAPAKVLVTGANGYVGTWTVRKYLEAGYSVRGTVRDVSKQGPYLKNLFSSHGDKFELIEIKDITVPGAFDEAIKDIAVVAHTTPSPFNESLSVVNEVVTPAVQGTLRALEASKKTPSVKRFIVLSTVASLVNHGVPELNETLWNNHSAKHVEEKGDEAGGWDIYCASRMLAEKAAWDFAEQNKGSLGFDVVSLNPSYMFGPAIHDVPSLQKLNASLEKMYETVVAGTHSDELLSNWWMIILDVRDLAQIFVETAQSSTAGGERIMFGQGPLYDQQILDIVNKLSPPPLSQPLPKGVPGGTDSKPVLFKHNTSKAARIFGFKFRTVEETLNDTLLYYKEKGFAQ